MEYGWNCAAAAGLRGLNHRARILLLTSVDVRTRPKDKKGAANCKKKKVVEKHSGASSLLHLYKATAK